MTRLSRATAAAVCAIALTAAAAPLAASAAPLATPAAPAARPRPAAIEAFRPLPLPIIPTRVVSPAQGVAYVVGTDRTGTRVLRVEGAGRSVAPVRLPKTLTVTDVVAAGGHVLVLDAAAKVVYDIAGTKVVRTLAIPATVPEATLRFAAARIGASSLGSIWVLGTGSSYPGEPPTPMALHAVARGWQTTVVGARFEAPATLHVAGGHVYATLTTPSGRIYNAFVDVSGGTVTRIPATDLTDAFGYRSTRPGWTFASPTDLTLWGAEENVGAGTAPRGTCVHVVDHTTVNDCTAPTWAVSAAVRLGDGSVVLGGADTYPGSTRPMPVTGGFARVAKPGANPTPIPGTNGDRVVELAAAPTGSTVWAITAVGTKTTLQLLSPLRLPTRYLPR